ncbi:hypothetical protein Ahy_A05g024873 isoform F [Arachis hypogaea]|uniref:Uncharacterized protein n=1 Tax=Arachis hypogaea TaxID=3818 RepID=A0A445D6X8_ARAHY|nr:hypothetical protein Ahy_A05g024873 isoform F [Arachis hypogaea]
MSTGTDMAFDHYFRISSSPSSPPPPSHLSSIAVAELLSSIAVAQLATSTVVAQLSTSTVVAGNTLPSTSVHVCGHVSIHGSVPI